MNERKVNFSFNKTIINQKKFICSLVALIYFNFQHKEYIISFSSDYNTTNNLELIEEKDLVKTLPDPLIIKIYRFKVSSYFLKKKIKIMNLKLL